MLVIAAVLAAQIFFDGGIDPLTTVALAVLFFGYAVTADD